MTPSWALRLWACRFSRSATARRAAVLRRIGKEDYGVIFITETVGEEMLPVVQEFAARPLPAILYIPNNQGSTGIGLEKIRRIVERAVGVDILTGKEGSQ